VSKKIPLCSSDKIVKALKRAGFQPARHSKGSHQAFVKETAERKYITIVILGKKEVPRGTLKSILDQAGLSVEEFTKYLR
jgi:predicted RNA binding protein YcfA (HicA-like mRNA interferase family)